MMVQFMDKISLKLGSKVDMRILQSVQRNGRGDEVDHYVSSIHDIGEDGTLELDMPMRAGKAVLLPMGLRYEVIFTMDQRLYKSEAEIIRRTRKEGFSLLVAKLMAPVEKFQRREYYRLDVMMPLSFITLDERAGELKKMADIRELFSKKDMEPVFGEGTIMNISGGGIRFVTTMDLEGVEYLFMRFAIETGGEAQNVALIGQILAEERMDSVRNRSYRVRILFKDSGCQELIIRYIFEQERKIRKKKLGG